MTPSQKRTQTMMLQTLLSQLPATKRCPKCGLEKDSIDCFGTRVTHAVSGTPIRAQIQSYCKTCRGSKVKVVETTVPAIKVESWTDAVLLVMAGQGTMKLIDIVAGVGAMAAVASKLASNKNWGAKVRQVVQQLRAKGQAASPAKGQWRLTF